MTLAITNDGRNHLNIYSEIIGPEEARELLGRNTNNRKVRAGHIRDLASDMKNGRWIENGDTIRLAADGTLLDGQHRMLAVVESGTDQRFLFVRGLANASQKTMDRNKSRTAADAVMMGGAEGNIKDSAAIARGLLMYRNGGRPTHMEIVEYTEAHLTELQAAAEAAKPIYREFGGGIARYGVAGYILLDIDRDAASDFLYLLATGDGLRPGNPIYALRSRLHRGDVMSRNRDRGSLLAVLELVFKAWNMWRDGSTVKLLKVGKSEPFPIPVGGV